MLGYPLAYAIAFKSGRWKNLMLVAVIAPFFTSFLVRTLSWKLILPDQGFLMDTLRSLHLVGADTHLLASPLAVITGLTYNFLPFMVLPLYASLEKVDHRLIEAGGDLYATPFTTFRKVTLPLSMPGLVAGTLLTFIPASGDFINAQLLGNPNTRMIGNEIQDLFAAGAYPLAAALSVTLMAAIVVMVLFYVRRAGTEEPRVTSFRRWVRQPRDPHRGPARAVLHVPADPRGHPDELQRPRRPSRLRVRRVHPRQLDQPVRPVPALLVSRDQPQDRAARDARRDHPRHSDGLRARAAPVPGRGLANLFIFLPMATPEIVLGSALLALFVTPGRPARVLDDPHRAHHVLHVVCGRHREGACSGLDPRLEQAAMDLYANEWSTFWRVTFPLVFPGIMAAALLSFSLSFDDFIITNLNAGTR